VTDCSVWPCTLGSFAGGLVYSARDLSDRTLVALRLQRDWKVAARTARRWGTRGDRGGVILVLILCQL